MPVMRPAQGRWLDLTLIIDASPSMALWRQTIAELRRLTERLGAFRVVRTFTADCSAGELTPITLRPGTPAGTAIGLSHRALSLIGADRRQAILVVTDAVGDAWKDGRMGPLLRLWGAAAPVGVAMVLPQRMWAGTGLSVVPAQLYSQFPGSANRALSLRPPGISCGTAPIPVMELTPRWLASWATLVADARGWRNMAVLAPENPPAHSASMPLSLSPAEAVRAFRLAASPAAFQLACYLSAAWLSLPVMRLVQQFMLPGSDPAHMAEVFLGGLLRAYPDNMTADPDTIQYDFVPGVRDELNRYLIRDEMLTVVDRTSQFIAARYGQSVDVAALLADPQGAPLPALTSGRRPPPPLHVAAAVLAKLGGRYRVLAERVTAGTPRSDATDSWPASGAHSPVAGTTQAPDQADVTEVFAACGRYLQNTLVQVHDPALGDLTGWPHFFDEAADHRRPTAIGTAYGLKLAAVLGEQCHELDQAALLETLWRLRRPDGGWSARAGVGISRPEVSALVAGTLAMYGGRTDRVAVAAGEFEDCLPPGRDPAVLERTYVLTSVIRGLIRTNPQSGRLASLRAALLDGAIRDPAHGDLLCWPAQMVSERHQGLPPSVPHTAEAIVTLIRADRVLNDDTHSRAAVNDALRWLAARYDLSEQTEQIQRSVADNQAWDTLIVRHFTPAWVARALLLAPPDIPGAETLLMDAVQNVWRAYREGYWEWNRDERPIWMAYQCACVLRDFALRTSSSL